MPELSDGQSVTMPGSGRLPYVLKNVGGVYSCSCPAWRNQSLPIERRTCKHLQRYRGEAAEGVRLGLPSNSPASGTTPRNAAPKVEQPPLLLAETWDGSQDVAGWWLSEKLDGVRAYWNGERFLSRQGNTFHAPTWFRAELPREPLDGELWLDRKAFQRTVSIVRRHDEPAEWRAVRYVIFDAPRHGGAFETRLDYCRQRFARHPAPFLRVLDQQVCRDAAQVQNELERILALGGEGLMLRQPESLYETRRSPTLLKVKRFLDAEARVVGHEPGKGRHQGRLGALLVELSGGVRFAVGSGFTDRQRERPPSIGAWITFRYQELSERGVPRFPTFVRVRTDAAAAS